MAMISKLALANHALRGPTRHLFDAAYTSNRCRGLSMRILISLRLREPNQSKVQLNSCQVTKVVSVNAERLAERPQHGCVTLNSDRPAIIGIG